jgi:hypothetical protein
MIGVVVGNPMVPTTVRDESGEKHARDVRSHGGLKALEVADLDDHGHGRGTRSTRWTRFPS